MYSIFFTIKCVEQLTSFKTFVDQLQFEQSLICCLKVKLLKKNLYYTYGRWLFLTSFHYFWHLLKLCWAVVFLYRPVFWAIAIQAVEHLPKIPSYDMVKLIKIQNKFSSLKNEWFVQWKWKGQRRLQNGINVSIRCWRWLKDLQRIT